jgi:hypothetical protein
MSEPELPNDPLCSLVRSWREEGVYQKALIDGRPAVEGTLATSLDRDTIIDEIKRTCETYHLTCQIEGEGGGLPFTAVHAKDGDLERTFLIFNVVGSVTMVKFSFQEASDPDLVSVFETLPELREMADQVGFKKENFVDGACSALLVFRDQLPPALALDKAESVLLGAGWVQSDLTRRASADSLLIFTKADFKLMLRSRAIADGATSMTCTVSQTKADSRSGVSRAPVGQE